MASPSSSARVVEASPQAIDYVQRLWPTPLAMPRAPISASATPDLRVGFRIDCVTTDNKYPPRASATDQRTHAPAEQLVIGLATYGVPLAFEVSGSSNGVSIRSSVWASPAEQGALGTVAFRGGILEGLLRGAYPGVKYSTAPLPAARRWPFSGLVLGVPSTRQELGDDGSNALDRLVRSLQGLDFHVLVLAKPLTQPDVADLREQCLRELREIESFSSAGARSPLKDYYTQVVQARLERMSVAQSAGGWRTAVYLLGDEQSYPLLSSAWQSMFAGGDPKGEPVRIFEGEAAGRWAARWAFPDTPAEEGPGYVHHPYGSQTVLTSRELAAMTNFPTAEVPGFRVETRHQFDSVPAEVRGTAINLGNTIARGIETTSNAHIGLSSINRHVLIAGVTGSGKTNTVLGLLMELDAMKVPFMVLEPAKAEYRSLLSRPSFKNRLRVFTAGRETVAPLRISPFDTPAAGIATHLDLLRVTFASAFGMWTPLPQVLERCLHEVYTDRGWDLARDENQLADQDRSLAFPTMTDLLRKVEDVLPRLGYDEKVRSDLQASLTTRLNSLRLGGKGRMLDVPKSMSAETLFEGNAVVELEALGSDDDKSFLMSLLLIKLAEHRRAQGPTDQLRHVLVIEEAHRLLSQPKAGGSEEEANPRGQAVEAFTNLLAEVRAYGQGVIIADQVPVRLAAEVMKNTAVKIAHRTVAAEDRTALAGAMSMTPEQSPALATLPQGCAVMFTDGEDAPLLVQTPLVKGKKLLPPSDDVVRRAMEEIDAGPSGRYCDRTCSDSPAACDAARELMDLPRIAGLVDRATTSAADDATALSRCWEDVTVAARAMLSAQDDESAVLRSLAAHAAEWYAMDRGLRWRWSHEAIAELRDALCDALLAQAGRGPRDRATGKLVQVAKRTQTRSYDPFIACATVCPDQSCLYRRSVERLLRDESWSRQWVDAALMESPGEAQWQVARSAAFRIVEWPDRPLPARVATNVRRNSTRAALCFAQQAEARAANPPSTSRLVMEEVLQAAQRTAEEPTAPRRRK